MQAKKAGDKKMEIEKKKVVPGNVEKRNKRDAKVKEDREKRRANAKAKGVENKKLYITRAEKYAAEY